MYDIENGGGETAIVKKTNSPSFEYNFIFSLSQFCALITPTLKQGQKVVHGNVS